MLLTKERKMQKIRFLAIAILVNLATVLIGCSSEEVLMPEIVSSIKRPAYEKLHVYEKPPPKKVEATLVPRLAGKVIVIDPGHGGKDPGAGEVGYSRLPEKTLVLAIAKNIKTQLKACGARVIMTRTADYFVSLNERAAIADKYKADLLLSIHIDSCPKGHVSGPTVYIANKACCQSGKVANSIHSSFVAAGIDSKGIRHAGFRVLVKHSRPAVLVECGYLTNGKDAQKLNNRWYRKNIAKLISNGVILAFGER